jgi:enoyl-CoA hydratase
MSTDNMSADNSENPVLVERHGAILVITMNRPRVRNAVNQAMSHGIAAAVDLLDADPALHVGILTGAGETFCSGMDLKAFVNGERPEIEGRGIAGISEAPPKKPLIAAVEGYALAGGCEIMLACDLVVAAETAKFGIPEVTRGLVAGAGGLLRLPQKIPTQIALEYALTGAHFSAGEARSWGLVNRLTQQGGALEGALELAGLIIANGPLAVQATKRIVMESANWSEREAFDQQRSIVDAVLATDDAREGAVAFAEKRPPVWIGK